MLWWPTRLRGFGMLNGFSPSRSWYSSMLAGSAAFTGGAVTLLESGRIDAGKLGLVWSSKDVSAALEDNAALAEEVGCLSVVKFWLFWPLLCFDVKQVFAFELELAESETFSLFEHETWFPISNTAAKRVYFIIFEIRNGRLLLKSAWKTRRERFYKNSSHPSFSGILRWVI